MLTLIGFSALTSLTAEADEDQASESVTYMAGFAEGKLTARGRFVDPPESWTGTGLIGGCLLGPVGCIGMAVGAGTSTVTLDEVPVPNLGIEAATWQEGYEEGYRAGVRGERVRKAFVGGAIGTAVFSVVLVAVASSSMDGGGGFLSGWGG